MKLGKLTVSAVIFGAGATAGAYYIWQYYKSRRVVYKSYTDSLRTVIVCSPEDWEAVESEVTAQLKTFKALGLDCEWVTSRQRGRSRSIVSLLQLALPSGLCVLVRTCRLSSLPPGLCSLLADRSILKLGVGVTDDANKLRTDFACDVSGCVDLRHLVIRRYSRADRPERLGLAALSQSLLGVILDKRTSVRCSNWEASDLSSQQVVYAACDAQVAVDMLHLMALRKLGTLAPDARAAVEVLRQPAGAAFHTARSLCQGLVDLPFKAQGNGQLGAAESKASSSAGGGVVAQGGARKPPGHSYCVRQSPLYHNCKLRAPDGQLLATCDNKKADWYIEKDLAVEEEDEEGKVRIIRLKFEPSGRPGEESTYYLTDKHNRCVVCGDARAYIRKSVVPHEYRKYFPSAMKTHRSHDVLLLCPPCHEMSCRHDAVLRQALARDCSAPLAQGNQLFDLNHDIIKVRRAARALKQSENKIPEKRKEELEKVIKDFYEVSSITPDLLQDASDLDGRVSKLGGQSATIKPHGQVVVLHVSEHGGLLEFEKRWRQHFLSAMKPRYLPKYWSVDHSHDVLKQSGEVKFL